MKEKRPQQFKWSYKDDENGSFTTKERAMAVTFVRASGEALGVPYIHLLDYSVSSNGKELSIRFSHKEVTIKGHGLARIFEALTVQNLICVIEQGETPGQPEDLPHIESFQMRDLEAEADSDLND